MYKHKLLIANSIITDPVFSGSVVFLFEHTKKGAQGVILNSKEVGVIGFGHMKDIFNAPPGTFAETKDMILSGKLQSVPLFLGGPCKTPGIFFIHGYEEYLKAFESQEQGSEFDLGIPSSFNIYDEDEKPPYQDDVPPSPVERMSITEGLYFGTPYTFGHLVESGKLDENKFRFFTGMSIWSAGQLEYEIENGAWTVVDSDPEIFFNSEKIKKLVKSVVGDQPTVEISEESSKKVYPWMPDTPPGFNPLVN